MIITVWRPGGTAVEVDYDEMAIAKKDHLMVVFLNISWRSISSSQGQYHYLRGNIIEEARD